jgi:predicted phosphodiesterase
MTMFQNATVIADIHGVSPALEAMLAEEMHDPSEVVLVLGDIAFGPQPNQVVDRLRSLGNRVIAISGNSEREMLEIIRGEPVESSDPIAAWSAHELTPANRDWLAALPGTRTIEIAGFGEVFLCHACPQNDMDILLVDTRIARWMEAFADLPESVAMVLLGHTHMPFQRLVNGRRVINPGSIGMPYGGAGAHWVRLRDGIIETRVTQFDIERATREVGESSGFPGAAEWVAPYLRSEISDVEVIRIYGPKDGRGQEVTPDGIQDERAGT